MVELSKGERHIISSLCKTRKDDVVLWSCIEGNIGKIWVNSKASISCALVIAADFCFLLGGFEKMVEYEALIDILTEHCKGKVFISEIYVCCNNGDGRSRKNSICNSKRRKNIRK